MTNQVPYRQRYDQIEVMSLEEFSPHMSLTVIVPVRDRGDGEGQGRLDLVLASLAAQSYPDELLHVLVVDDASPAPVKLGSRRPVSTTLLRLEDDGDRWGKARAVNESLARTETELVMSLDADMCLHPDHLRAMARWVHASPCAVVLGDKILTEDWQRDPNVVHELLTGGRFDEIALGQTQPHEYYETLLAQSKDLRDADSMVFRALVGASVMMRTALLRSVAGYDTEMRLAEDTELGYRLVQAGAVLIPERSARAWHLGLTTMTNHRDVVLRHNQALLAARVPLLGYLRKPQPGRAWAVPSVVVAINCTEGDASSAGELTAQLLRGALGVDAEVVLVGQWPTGERYSVVDDVVGELRRLTHMFEGEPRVRFSSQVPLDVHPAPVLITVPGSITIASVRSLHKLLVEKNVGVVAVASQDEELAATAAWSTAALRRTAFSAPLPRACVGRAERVAAVWGAWWLDESMVPKSSSEASSIVTPTQTPRSLAKLAGVAFTQLRAGGFRPSTVRRVARRASRLVRKKAGALLK